jgi:hypothetical protein
MCTKHTSNPVVVLKFTCTRWLTLKGVPIEISFSFGFFFPNNELKKDSFFSPGSAGDITGDACERGVVEGERGGVVIVVVVTGLGREEAYGFGGGIGGAEFMIGGVVP